MNNIMTISEAKNKFFVFKKDNGGNEKLLTTFDCLDIANEFINNEPALIFGSGYDISDKIESGVAFDKADSGACVTFDGKTVYVAEANHPRIAYKIAQAIEESKEDFDFDWEDDEPSFEIKTQY